MRWGEKLEFVAEAGPGDFIFVPPWVPHQEINAGEEGEGLECVLMRYVQLLSTSPYLLWRLDGWYSDEGGL